MNQRGKYARLPLLIAVLLLLALIPFALFRGSQAPQAEAAWWDNAWRYRKPIQVTNNTTQQNNVYISLTLDTSDTTKFQDDCGDLRFTKQNGQVLPYYLAGGCGTASTSVHVQLDAFPSGEQAVFVYYGNLSAPNGSTSSDFLMEATNYSVGGTGGEETGPGPVAYWKFDEGSGQIAHDSAGYSPGQEVLNDGDMEAPDIDAWTAAYSTISKESDTPYGGSNYLRITPTSGYPAARQQVLKVGQSYRFKGWVRIQAGQEWRVRCTTTNIITGIGSGDWEYVDVHFVATTDTLGLSGVNASVPVEWDDVSVIETASGNHGTITGATWASEDQCVSGKCLSFDGNDYVSVGSDPSLDVDTMSVSVWVYPTLSTGWYTIFQRADGAPNGYRLKISNTQKWAFSGGLSGTFAQSSQNVQANTWTHIVGTYDGIVNKIYVNGQLAASFEESGTLPSTAGEVAMIGSYGAGTSQNFPGLLDEVKIFPYALTEDEIKAEYNLGAAAVIGTGPAAPPPEGGNLDDSLVAHWAFDEQAGQTAHDRVGNNHGTFGADTNPGSDDPTWKLAGECKVNGCASFDGGNYILRPTSTGSPLVVTNSSVTLSAWVNPSAYPASRGGIVGRQYASVFGYGVSIGSNGSFGILIRNSSDGFRHYDSSISIPLNTWTHLVASIEDTGTATTLKFFANGSLVATVTDAIQIVSPNDTSPILIGVESPTYSNFFQGKIDEVKIYNTALTPEQVLQDMNAGASLTVGVGADEADEIIDGAGAPPIAEWKFDENQGTTAYDTSGNGNDGTVNGAAWKSGCQQGACLEFDGNAQHITVPDNPSLSLTNAWTLEAWALISDANQNRRILSKAQEWGIQITGGDEVKVIANSNAPVTTSNSPIHLGRWHHIAARYDGSTIKVFVDGSEKASANYSTNTEDTSDNLTIGGGYGNEWWKGQIDHIKIYDYARTQAQIAYDYNRGAPVAHWRFDECEGTVAHDSSDNHNHGTINIGATEPQTTAGTCQTSGAWANGKDGKFDGSLSLDGADDYVEINNSSSLFNFSGTAPFTLAAWVRPSSLSTGRIISKSNEAISIQWELRQSGDKFTMKRETPPWSLVGSTTITPGNWYHVASIYDGANQSLYVNGRLDAGPTAFGSVASNNQPVFLGAYQSNNNVSSFFKGQIDDIRVYNYALSPAQVQKVYNQGYSVRYGPN